MPIVTAKPISLKCKVCGGDIVNNYLAGTSYCANCGNRWSIADLYPDYAKYQRIIANITKANDIVESENKAASANEAKLLYKTCVIECTKFNDPISSDLIRICEKHDDCVFLTFTNGTLIDEAFADEMLRVGNFVPAISLEGFEGATDSRRGKGVYDHVIKAMRLLREKKLPFGVSACYTSQNYESISSEEFYDLMIDEGAFFVWFFHYMPVGNDASVELLPSPEQRTGMYKKIREYRATKPLFAMDFQNDAEFVSGCIAGGKRYLHINANGDIDPCVFVHYSDSNIREKTLLEALQSPMLMQYHDNIPFNDNMLMPCPMLENSGKLTEMVNAAGAHSTDLQSPESAEHLCAKTKQYADNWTPVAEKLWEERQKES